MENLISVIVPVYNTEKYIENTVKSICNQSYKNLEIILVDDGSTDHSPLILDELAELDSRIIVIHKDNQGVTLARLTGVQYSRGDYIGFVDSDDYIEEGMYERLLKNLQENNSDISHCGYQMVFEDGRVSYFHNTGIKWIHNNNQEINELLSGQVIEPGLCNKLFNRKLFEKLINNSLMDDSIKINEDLLMNYYLFKQSKKIVYEDFCPYHYLVRQGSTSRSKINKAKIFDPIKVKKIILDDCNEENRIEAVKAYIFALLNSYNSLVIANDFHKEKLLIRNMIRENTPFFNLLVRKYKLMVELISYSPVLYEYLYKFYVNHFQDKRYE